MAIIGICNIQVNANENKPELKIGYNQFEPVTMREGKQLKGMWVDIWEELARRLNYDYEYIYCHSFERCIKDLQNGKLDVTLSGTTVSLARERLMDYSHPIQKGGQMILVRTSESMWWRVIDIIMSKSLLYVLLIFLGILLLSAHVIWWIERKVNPVFPRAYLRGILEGVWWTVVTLTTVGYGDKIPKKVAGKIFAIFWMIAGYFVLAYFTASISAVLTLTYLNSDIQGLHDLKGKKVATAKGQYEIFLRPFNMDLVSFETIDDCYSALEQGEVDAVIFDDLALKYYASHYGQGKLEVVGSLFLEHYWALGLQSNSPIQESLNREILKLKEEGFIQEKYQQWYEQEGISVH